MNIFDRWHPDPESLIFSDDAKISDCDGDGLEAQYVFEDGGPDKGGLIRATQPLPPFLPAPSFEPGREVKPSRKWPSGRKGVVQLQAADYLAYEIRKFVMDHPLIKVGARQFRASLGALPEDKIDRAFVTCAKLEALCRLANIKRRH